MKLRNIAPCLVLAAAAFAGPAAQADTVTVRNTIPIVVQADGAGGQNAVFGNTFAAPGATSYSFVDTYLFTAENMAGFIPFGALTSLYMKLSAGVGQSEPQVKDLHITGFGLYTYYDGHTGSEYSTARNESPYDPSGTGGLDRWTFDYGSSLPRGTWAVRVTGDVVGNAGGSYSATIALMPIPEPQEWGMLLAGLGVVGALARRRKARPA
jgi:hypothetical protein